MWKNWPIGLGEGKYCQNSCHFRRPDGCDADRKTAVNDEWDKFDSCAVDSGDSAGDGEEVRPFLVDADSSAAAAVVVDGRPLSWSWQRSDFVDESPAGIEDSSDETTERTRDEQWTLFVA